MARKNEMKPLAWLPPDGVFGAVLEDVRFELVGDGEYPQPTWRICALATEETTGKMWLAREDLPLNRGNLFRVYKLLKATGAPVDLTAVNLREVGDQLRDLPLRIRCATVGVWRDGATRFESRIVRFLAPGEDE